jgi:molybdopterin-guanine dinucleotide biosynthesis protein A
VSATAAIVLAGGRSTRMGTSKAALEWHGSTLLRRAAGLAARAVDGPVVVVRAPGQELPALPARIELVDDAREGRGPLQGLAAGLAAIGDRAQVAYLTGVDAPFLHPAFACRVLALLEPGHDVAIPHADGFAQPLAAAYRVASVAPALRALLEEHDERGAPGSRALLARCRVRELPAQLLLQDARLAARDPALESLRNLNDPNDYEAARARPAPAVTVAVDDGAPQHHHAATLAAAARAAGCTPAELSATIDGRAATDPQEPLAAGDAVALRTQPASEPARSDA